MVVVDDSSLNLYSIIYKIGRWSKEVRLRTWHSVKAVLRSVTILSEALIMFEIDEDESRNSSKHATALEITLLCLRISMNS